MVSSCFLPKPLLQPARIILNSHRVLQHTCSPSQVRIIFKLSNCNPDDRMKSTNECAEYYWSRTISLLPRVTQWVQQAACFCTFHTGDSALFQVQILHQESYTLFPKTDLWQTLKLPTKWYRDTIKHVIEIYIGRDTRSNLLSPHQRTSVLSFIWECTFMYEQMYLHIQGS